MTSHHFLKVKNTLTRLIMGCSFLDSKWNLHILREHTSDYKGQDLQRCSLHLCSALVESSKTTFIPYQLLLLILVTLL